MNKFVKIKITNEENKILEHHFVRADEWGVPGGVIEDGEGSKEAAQRELLERTGYEIPKELLTESEEEKDTITFCGKSLDMIKVAEPGERGGYATKIRWR